MGRPDLILHNAHVVTMDRRRPRAGLVAVRGDRVVFVGDDADLSRLRGPGTRVVDCAGATVLPGFIDAHIHLFAYAASLSAIDCSPSAVRSIAQLQAVLRRGASRAPPGAWLRGAGYNEFYLAEKRHPTRHDLDVVTPSHPVKLTHRSGHAVALNSLAMRLAGIARDTPDPVDGVIDRDASGEPTGLFFEMAEELERRVPPLSPQEMREGLRRAGRALLQRGVTSLHEATPDGSLERYGILRTLRGKELALPRIYKMVGFRAVLDPFDPSTGPSLALEGSLRLGSGRTGTWLRLGAVKFMLHETTGALQPPIEELREQAREVCRAGFQLSFHAVEPSAIEAAADAIEYAYRSVRPKRMVRPRIEHCSVCPPPLLERLRALGVIVVTNPGFLYHSGDRYRREVPTEQRPWLYRIRSFFRAGLRPAAGSDAPVEEPDPLLQVYAAVTRRCSDRGELVGPRGRTTLAALRTNEGQALLPQERVTLRQALAMHTVNAAYAAGEEREKGSVTPGKLADLVVLDRALDERRPQTWLEARVRATVLGGRVLEW